MIKLMNCRRTFIAFVGIVCLTGLGLYLGVSDVAGPISVIAIGLSASNAYQGKSDK